MKLTLAWVAVVLYGIGILGGISGYVPVEYAMPMLLPGLVIMAQGMCRT